MAAKIDLTGKKFGRLTVISFKRRKKLKGFNRSARLWNCLCDCGNEVIVEGTALRSGHTKSCGCLALEVRTTHGMTNTRQYKIFIDMKIRCDDKGFEGYGGRGISYDPKWITFEGFWEDMSEGYADNLTLDRIDPNGNYTKENCRWITKTLQTRNRRKYPNNKTGVTGVSLRIDKEGNKICYLASCMSLDGVRMTKTYSIRKYGDEEAFRLACEFRETTLKLLNEQGAGYTENHGI